MRALRPFGIVAALAVVAGASAERITQTVVVSGSVPFTDTDWNQDVSIPKFSHPFGQLDSVKVNFAGGITSSFFFENLNAVSRDYNATASYDLRLNGPSNQELLRIQPSSLTQQGTLAAFDEEVDFAGASGASFPELVADATGTVTLTSASDLAAFSGAGNVSFNADAKATSSIDSSANLFYFILTQAKVDVEVTYTYSYDTASVGNRVWVDKNSNGQQDPGEPSLPGVAVKLLDANGTEIASTVTNSQGEYLFENLTPGSYAVKFGTVTGAPFTSATAVVDGELDSDAGTDGQTAFFSLASGQNRRDIDAGVIGNLSLGNRVWLDGNANGKQDSNEPGLPGVTVKLLDTTGNVLATTSTGTNGIYTFDGLLPGNYVVQVEKPTGYTITGRNLGGDLELDSDIATDGKTATINLTQSRTDIDAGLFGSLCLGDRVWFDDDKDGIQDSCENGVEGVLVNLLDANGNVVLSTRTDCNGYYSFERLAPGNYSVQFVAPAGYAFTKALQGTNRSVDSDANVTTGRSASFNLTANRKDLDAGLIGTLKIGDTVWVDSDEDGKFEPELGEIGIPCVSVRLLGDLNNDGKADVVLYTTTDKNGKYLFTHLVPGRYQVAVDAYDIPRGYNGTYDLDGLGTKNVATANLTVDGDRLDFDFGYSPSCPPCPRDVCSWANSCDLPNILFCVGNSTYTESQCLNLLRSNHCGDGTVALAQQLLAAKLNVGKGVNPAYRICVNGVTLTVEEAIRRADAWLKSNPVGSKVYSNTSKWAQISAVYGILCRFNG